MIDRDSAYASVMAEIKALASADDFLDTQVRMTKERLNIELPTSLEFNANLAYWLYVTGNREPGLRLAEVFMLVPFEGNYDKWSCVETCLSLPIFHHAQAGDEPRVKPYRAVLDAALATEHEFRETNAQALRGRLTGILLYDSEIQAARESGAIKEETDWRFMQLQELCVIHAYGGSPEQPVENLRAAIVEQIEVLARLAREHVEEEA